MFISNNNTLHSWKKTSQLFSGSRLQPTIIINNNIGMPYNPHTNMDYYNQETNLNNCNLTDSDIDKIVNKISDSNNCNQGTHSNNSELTDCDIDKLINTISDKFTSNMIKDRLILEFYETLYNEVIIHINKILETFQTKTIGEVIELYNHDSFLCLIAKISTIKNDLLKHFCDTNNLPKFVNIFIDNYLENLYIILHSFKYMLSYIGEFNVKQKCCEVLSSLENIQEYVKEHYKSGGLTMAGQATITTPLILKEPYSTYCERHGPPGKEGFITSLLADITAELGC